MNMQRKIMQSIERMEKWRIFAGKKGQNDYLQASHITTIFTSY